MEENHAYQGKNPFRHEASLNVSPMWWSVRINMSHHIRDGSIV